MLCRLFDNRKYMDIYLGKQKISLYFSASTCEHLWPSLFWAFKVRNMLYIPSKDAADWSVVADFKSLLSFKVNFFKSGLVKLVCSWIFRHENIKVILGVQLWELGTQRLHHGLSETILVNTLTDVRELKKTKMLIIRLHCLTLDGL